MSGELPYGYTLFCDDIRREIGGKSSYIGVYKTDLAVAGGFPYSLPQLGLVIIYSETRDPPSSGPVTFKIFMPGDEDDSPSIKGEFPMDEARQYPSDPNVPAQDKRLTVTLRLVLSPVVLHQEGYVKVRAYTENAEVRLGTLKVVRAPRTGQDDEEIT